MKKYIALTCTLVASLGGSIRAEESLDHLLCINPRAAARRVGNQLDSAHLSDLSGIQHDFQTKVLPQLEILDTIAQLGEEKANSLGRQLEMNAQQINDTHRLALQARVDAWDTLSEITKDCGDDIREYISPDSLTGLHQDAVGRLEDLQGDLIRVESMLKDMQQPQQQPAPAPTTPAGRLPYQRPSGASTQIPASFARKAGFAQPPGPVGGFAQPSTPAPQPIPVSVQPAPKAAAAPAPVPPKPAAPAPPKAPPPPAPPK